MDKLQRKLLKQKKYFRRLKRVASWGAQIKTEEGTWKPAKWFELINKQGYNCYKTTGTPCSCWMCSYGKYNRLETKKETKRIIEES